MSDDPAEKAVLEAFNNGHLLWSVGAVPVECECGVSTQVGTHLAHVAVEAARPIIEAEKDQEIHAERLLHRLQEDRIREEAGKAPRWEDDPIVLENGWDEGRCGRCGERLPRRAADNGEPGEDPADESVTESGPPSCMEPKYHVGGSLPSGVTQQILETFGVTQAEVDAVRAVERGEITWDQLGAADNGEPD